MVNLPRCWCRFFSALAVERCRGDPNYLDRYVGGLLSGDRILILNLSAVPQSNVQMPHSYRQPEKNAVRERVLTAAIDALTENRNKSAIVVPDELSETIDVAMQSLKVEVDRESLKNEFDNWRQGYRNHVGRKEASELRVLYLCGPEPLNDLSILIEKGVLPQNVWAVEQNPHDVARAASDLAQTHPIVRRHPGSLEDLFQVYPGRFDIVYFDACGSLFSRGALNVLLTLSAQAKLEPMAVLIRNFANFDGARENFDAMCQFFRFRNDDLPRVPHGDPLMSPYDDSDLKWSMRQDIEPFYSDFITRFITDLYRYWIPNTRALALRAVSKHYMADLHDVTSQMEEAVGFPDSAKTIEELVRKIGCWGIPPCWTAC